METETITTSPIATKTLNAISFEIHQNNIEAGWWSQEEKDHLNIGGKIHLGVYPINDK